MAGRAERADEVGAVAPIDWGGGTNKGNKHLELTGL